MTTEQEIQLNSFGQGLIDITVLLQVFTAAGEEAQQQYLQWLLFCIQQSKPLDSDTDAAIASSGLKSTYTCCVMLKRLGLKMHVLKEMVKLPVRELDRVWVLYLSIFKIAYHRRFEKEKNHPDKWWYWDLAEEENLKKIRSL